jgi:hypothetical protein
VAATCITPNQSGRLTFCRVTIAINWINGCVRVAVCGMRVGPRSSVTRWVLRVTKSPPSNCKTKIKQVVKLRPGNKLQVSEGFHWAPERSKHLRRIKETYRRNRLTESLERVTRQPMCSMKVCPPNSDNDQRRFSFEKFKGRSSSAK